MWQRELIVSGQKANEFIKVYQSSCASIWNRANVSLHFMSQTNRLVDAVVSAVWSHTCVSDLFFSFVLRCVHQYDEVGMQ